MAILRSNTGGIQLDQMVSMLRDEHKSKYEKMVSDGDSVETILDYLRVTIKSYFENDGTP